MNTSTTSTNDFQDDLARLTAIRDQTADILAWIDEEGIPLDEEEGEEEEAQPSPRRKARGPQILGGPKNITKA